MRETNRETQIRQTLENLKFPQQLIEIRAVAHSG
jgi:hypothetical protein